MSSATDTFGTTPLIRVSTGARTPDGERALRTARNAADSVPIVRTGPTGITAHTPLVAATDGGRTAMFADPTPTTIESLVETLEGGTLPSEHADAIVDHDPDTETLPTPDSGPLSVGRRSVLGPCGWIDPVAADDWTFRSPERSAAPAAEAGLCGRGRGDAVADAPVADAWETARETEGDPVVVVNANDADERTRADGVLLGGSPDGGAGRDGGRRASRRRRRRRRVSQRGRNGASGSASRGDRRRLGLPAGGPTARRRPRRVPRRIADGRPRSPRRLGPHRTPGYSRRRPQSTASMAGRLSSTRRGRSHTCGGPSRPRRGSTRRSRIPGRGW